MRKNTKKIKMTTSKPFLYWAPRILCIVAILFVSMFALDSFSPELTIWQQIGGFLVHLIPTYVLIALLVVAWRWEYVGGIIFTVIGIAFAAMVFMANYNRNHFSLTQSLINTVLVAVPFILVGILFILNSKYQESKA